MARLRYSQRAITSLADQDAYLRARAPQAANRVLDEIERLADLIAELPTMGRQIDGTGLRYHLTRRYKYRVIYRCTKTEVQIVDILHPRQEPIR